MDINAIMTKAQERELRASLRYWISEALSEEARVLAKQAVAKYTKDHRKDIDAEMAGMIEAAVAKELKRIKPQVRISVPY